MKIYVSSSIDSLECTGKEKKSDFVSDPGKPTNANVYIFLFKKLSIWHEDKKFCRILFDYLILII